MSASRIKQKTLRPNRGRKASPSAVPPHFASDELALSLLWQAGGIQAEQSCALTGLPVPVYFSAVDCRLNFFGK
jgi:hypothetical protein